MPLTLCFLHLSRISLSLVVCVGVLVLSCKTCPIWNQSSILSASNWLYKDICAWGDFGSHNWKANQILWLVIWVSNMHLTNVQTHIANGIGSTAMYIASRAPAMAWRRWLQIHELLALSIMIRRGVRLLIDPTPTICAATSTLELLKGKFAHN